MSEVKRYVLDQIYGYVIEALPDVRYEPPRISDPRQYVPASDYDAMLQQDSETIIAAGRKLAEAMGERDVALAEIERLRAALRKLSNEVEALAAFDIAVRAAIGNTNWNVLVLRLNEARAALREEGK